MQMMRTGRRALNSGSLRGTTQETVKAQADFAARQNYYLI